MLDALAPASEALSAAARRQLSARECVEAMVAAAAAGAESTKSMRASAGRAAYVPEENQAGVPDPGAMGAVEWLRGINEALGSDA